jgi:hypothetical protein
VRYNGTGKKEQGKINGRNQKRKGVYTWVEMNFKKRTLSHFCESNLLKEVNP